MPRLSRPPECQSANKRVSPPTLLSFLFHNRTQTQQIHRNLLDPMSSTFTAIPGILLPLLLAVLVSSSPIPAEHTLEDGPNVYNVPNTPSGVDVECVIYSYFWSKSGFFANETLRAEVKEFCADSIDANGWCSIGSKHSQTYLKFSSVLDGGVWIAGVLTDKQSDICPPAPTSDPNGSGSKEDSDRKKRSPFWSEEWQSVWSPYK